MLIIDRKTNTITSHGALATKLGVSPTHVGEWADLVLPLTERHISGRRVYVTRCCEDLEAAHDEIRRYAAGRREQLRKLRQRIAEDARKANAARSNTTGDRRSINGEAGNDDKRERMRISREVIGEVIGRLASVETKLDELLAEWRGPGRNCVSNLSIGPERQQ